MSIEKVMFLDYETYSSVDIKNGVYAYTEAPDFEVLLVSFRAPGRELLQFSPREDGTDCEAARLFFGALSDESLLLKARNAQFERVCTSAYFKRVIHPDRWRCTAVLCAAAGLPRSLDESGRALGLAEDERKLKTGTALINYFCKPCKPTAANGGRTRNLPGDSPEKWRLFEDYNRRDVEADIAIADRLSAYTPTEAEQRLYSLDQIIADRGVRADTGLIDKVNGYVATHGEELIAEMKELTGLDNPNSLSRLRDWLKANGAADHVRQYGQESHSGSPQDRSNIRQGSPSVRASPADRKDQPREVCQGGRVRQCGRKASRHAGVLRCTDRTMERQDSTASEPPAKPYRGLRPCAQPRPVGIL
jgi:DNA polymerase